MDLSIRELCIIGPPESLPAIGPKSIWPLGDASEQFISFDDDATL